jgi:hypothetical protein
LWLDGGRAELLDATFDCQRLLAKRELNLVAARAE